MQRQLHNEVVGRDGHAQRAPPYGEYGLVEGERVDFVPHVVAWNLTRRCNLACAHCYIAAGPTETATGELPTADCHRILDDVLAVNPAVLLILSGGEPLLRADLGELASHASERGATVVIGTNGTGLTDARIAALVTAGVRGVAVSVDSLRQRYHDNFRHGRGALQETLDAVARLRAARLDVVIQSTVTRGNRAELPDLVAWAADQGAVAFNCYFLVPTGRGVQLGDLAPIDIEAVLADLARWERDYRGRMLVRAKCAPHFMRHVHGGDPDSPVLNYETRCPCGTQYCRITPDGLLTPCPYLPEPAGDLRMQRFADIWREAPLFQRLRGGALGGRCGRCEYRGICGGCRARAFAVSGDVLAEDPSCTYEPAGDQAVIAPARAVTYGAAYEASLPWSDAARARVARIPSFVRGVVMARVERYARERGRTEITPELLAEVREAMPIDFSKRRPFFAAEPEA